MISLPAANPYLSSRPGSNAWARSEHNIHSWREGRLLDVMPLTCEIAPNIDCNANCPDCPYARSRRLAACARVGPMQFLDGDDRTAMTRQTAYRVIEACQEAGVLGMLWTGGGEATIMSWLPEALRYSARLGMVNSLYTNGVQLGWYPELAAKIMAPETNLAFVRVSVNAISPRAIQRHWGVKDPGDILPQLDGLKELFRLRDAFRSRYEAEQRFVPGIEVSTIVDANTIGDLMQICETAAGIAAGHRATATASDFLVVRPLVNHRTGRYSCDDYDQAVIHKILAVCGPAGRGRAVVESAGLRMALGFGLDRLAAGEFQDYGAFLRQQYEGRRYFWSQGVFLTVGPDGSAHLCTEKNCDPAWAFGNLAAESVADIYNGPRRRALLEVAHSCALGPALLEPNTRSTRLNRIASEICAGRVDQEVIEAVRIASLAEPPMLLS